MVHERVSRRLLFSGVTLLLMLSVSTNGQSEPGVGFPLKAGVAYGPAPVLGVQDGVFTVNGQKKFLVFGSYFGALRDAIKYPHYVVDILNSAKLYGFDGIRVFPNWWNDPPNLQGCVNQDPNLLILGNGFINTNTPSGTLGAIPQGVGNWNGYAPTVAGRFQFLLDVAYEKGLLVDVSFAPEPVDGLDEWGGAARAQNFAEYKGALGTLAYYLSITHYSGPAGEQTGYRHVFFDLGNEHNFSNGCHPEFTEAEVLALRNAVKQNDPYRLVTASYAGEASYPDQGTTAWQELDDANLDIVAYHEYRFPVAGYEWWQLVDERLIGAPNGYQGWRQTTNDALPILFQEPERHRFIPEGGCNQIGLFPPPGCSDNYTSNEFLEAAKAAKAYGAASWTLHTERLFRYASNYSPGMSAVEGNFIDRMSAELAAVPWPR